MAKSMRSKRKRMFRALKREKYAKKELVKLKQLLGVGDQEMKEAGSTEAGGQSGATEGSDKTTQGSASTEDTSMEVVSEETGKMDVDRKTSGKKNISMKDLRDEHGTYPVWVSGRQIKKAKARRQGKKAKRAGKGRRTAKGKGLEW
ncbi:PREDICTED: protein LLP homolog [Branchiostoma belcheri]|uniref:Protein LLP homolog n=1 Tax=Branchiostoma belcheri TaxID=7741 RepID=A0A6P4YPA8_BRABE|nr:PREDICTED: protein LLP homolog [Branchiostoma belcheri]